MEIMKSVVLSKTNELSLTCLLLLDVLDTEDMRTGYGPFAIASVAREVIVNNPGIFTIGPANHEGV